MVQPVGAKFNVALVIPWVEERLFSMVKISGSLYFGDIWYTLAIPLQVQQLMLF